LNADKNEKKIVLNEWNVYFYDDLSKLVFDVFFFVE